jgi:hypothetical protein
MAEKFDRDIPEAYRGNKTFVVVEITIGTQKMVAHMAGKIGVCKTDAEGFRKLGASADGQGKKLFEIKGLSHRGVEMLEGSFASIANRIGLTRRDLMRALVVDQQ